MNENENTFWNYFMIVVLIIIIWHVFFNNKENFGGIFSLNPMPNLSKIPKELNSEDKSKIIQKINRIDKAMIDYNYLNSNDQYQDYAKVVNQPINQYAMTSLTNTNQEQNQQMYKNLKQNLLQDDMYPNLSSTKSFTPREQEVQNISEMPISELTPNTRSLKLMNQVGFIDGEKVACNLLGVDSENMDAYKKKFYSMYAHQIQCPAKCNMDSTGMSKGCGMGSKCGLQKDCSNINTETSIPDTFALSYLALDNANKKPCVTCNFKPIKNPLNREWMENFSYDKLPKNVKIADEERLKKMNITDANVSNYVNFENNVYQDSIGVSAADKINEIRTCQDANGTCSLKDYGTSIANAYDKLTANPAYTSRNSCDPYQLTGILEDAASTDMYANIK